MKPDHLPVSDSARIHTCCVSLVIAVYKRVDFLELVLMSVARQSFRDLEVIIAEDDQAAEVSRLIRNVKPDFPFVIKHVSQEDKGFRKNRILNGALKVALGQYVIFIDGDCLLHKKFIEEHVKHLGPDVCLFGRRAMLGRKTSEKLLRKKTLKGLSFFQLLFTKCRHVENALYAPWLRSSRKRGIKGSNFSLRRDLMEKINGFDEDFEKPYGGEDTDVERRLRMIGVGIVSTKFKTVQYHLYHGGRESRLSEWESEGKLFCQKKNDEGLWFCKNGLKSSGRT